MKRSITASLLIILLAACACDKSPVSSPKDDLTVADGDDIPISDDAFPPSDEDALFVPDEEILVDGESPVDVEAVVLPDEDLLPEQGGCGPESEPEPVESDHIVRLTRQWGGESSLGYDSGYAVAFAPSGALYIAGSTDSSFDCHQHAGETDSILLKVAPDGTLIWSRQWGTEKDDWPLAITVDMQGDIFVAGVTAGPLDGEPYGGGTKDIFVTKWHEDGTKLWTKLWGGASMDFAFAITLDNEGNLIITGHSGGKPLLAKWDTDGNEVWSVVWSETSARGYAVAVAPGGDIIVAGSTTGDLDGNTHAGGRCSCTEFPFGSGQVACTSCSDLFLSRFTADGERISTVQWGLHDSDDIAKGLFITQEGDLFVAGMTDGAFEGTTNAGGDCGYNYCADVFLTRLDAAGNILWTRQEGLPGDDLCGGLGSDGADLFLAVGPTLKGYDLTGEELWSVDSGIPFPRGIAVSEEGAIAVTGYQDTGSANHDLRIGLWETTGVTEWSALFSGNKAADQLNAIAVAPDGALFMAGSTNGALAGNQSAGGVDTFLAKSNGDGLLHWMKQAGTAENDVATAVAVDTAGNVYLTGYTAGVFDGESNAGKADIFLIKRKNDGGTVWTRQWGTGDDPAGYDDDVGRAVAVDGEGNVYVAGSMAGSVNYPSGHVFLTKITAAGAEVWTEEWESESATAYSTPYAVAYGVTVDQTGNIFVTGETVGDLDGQTNKGADCVMTGEGMHGGIVSYPLLCADGFITKFTPAGIKEWTVQWGTPRIDIGRAIAIGADGFVYVAGSSGDYTVDGAARSMRQALVKKFSPDGEEVWTELRDTKEWTDARSIAMNANGDIFVTGHARERLDPNLSSFGTSAVFLMKMNDAGTQLWAEQWGSPLNDQSTALVVAPDGRIFVGGYTEGNLDGNQNRGGADIFLSIIDEK